VQVKPYAAVIAGMTVLIVAVAAGIALLGDDGFDPIPPSERCLATANETTVMLDHEQAGNAAVIAGIAVRRGLPARAVTIALATAYQESGLRNLNHGDRDSLGLFQQRPSMGWGTPEQVRNPHYAAGKFYDALVKVDGYERLPVTQAADRVQRSAFPEAYGDHEADARVLASALTGNSAAGFSCVVRHDAKGAEDEGRNGLTPRADQVRRSVLATFGKVKLGGYAPGGINSGHMEGSAHYDGRAIDVFTRPISVKNTRRGWAYASYLVANADRLGIQTVIYSDKIWTAGRRSDDGWRPYTPPQRAGNSDTLRHRDHVHVDVVAD
jgi:hypothetical protein